MTLPNPVPRPLVQQRNAVPTRKIGAAGAAGAVVTVVVWVVSLAGLEIPAEVAAAVTLLLTVAAGYIVRDRYNG